ncbi:zinc finger MYM-type protein 5 isoform X2 [Cynocephalus volans]|uniref:zinc finger MYM-type protein 5 isoform X2 n=1 Tax=Cynocephalus volans TaxID=110931 RepID=UPI002FC933E1
MDKCSVRGLELTEQTPTLLGSTAMAASLMDIGSSFGDPASPLVSRSKNSSVEDDDDDDVVFIESVQPPSTSAPAIADQSNLIFASSKNEKPQGSYSIILPPSRDLASQKGNISETIVIDDEEDIETNGGEEKNSSGFIEWGLPGTKNRTIDLDFSTSSLSRSKTKTGVRPFNPGSMNVAGDIFQNGESATHHNPDDGNKVKKIITIRKQKKECC